MSLLDGVKVVSLTHYLQGPSCVQFLADLGAEVVKVERLGGAYERHWSGAQSFVEDQSVFYLLAGRNQESLELDWRTPEGADILWRLLEECDVVVENFRPGVLARYGFSYDDVRRRNPSIVYCSLTGFGSEGPRAGDPGQDLLIQSMSGLMSLSGAADGPPVPVGSAIVDQHAAALGAMGVLAALYRRAQTGVGAKVDSCLLLAALDLQVEPLSYHLNGSKLYDRSASGISSRFHQAPYGVFATKDGYLTLSLADGATLGAALDDDVLARTTRAEQFDDRETVNAAVAQHLATRTTDEWRTILTQAGVWHAPVNEYSDLLDDPQLEVLDAFAEVTLDGGAQARLINHPVRYDGAAPEIRRSPPRSGADTSAVLQRIGRSSDDVDRLRAEGVLGTPRAPGDAPTVQPNFYSSKDRT